MVREDGIYLSSTDASDPQPTRQNSSRWELLEAVEGLKPFRSATPGSYCNNCLEIQDVPVTMYYPTIRGKEDGGWICRDCCVRVGLLW